MCPLSFRRRLINFPLLSPLYNVLHSTFCPLIPCHLLFRDILLRRPLFSSSCQMQERARTVSQSSSTSRVYLLSRTHSKISPRLPVDSFSHDNTRQRDNRFRLPFNLSRSFIHYAAILDSFRLNIPGVRCLFTVIFLFLNFSLILYFATSFLPILLQFIILSTLNFFFPIHSSRSISSQLCFNKKFPYFDLSHLCHSLPLRSHFADIIVFRFIDGLSL